MEITCVKCGFKANAPDSLSGKKVRCPKCKEEFVIEAAPDSFVAVEEDIPPAASSPAPAAPPSQSVEEVQIATYSCRNTQLTLTNRHLKGKVGTIVANGNSTQKRTEDISVLLNQISSLSITDNKESLENMRSAICLVGAVLGATLGMIIGGTSTNSGKGIAIGGILGFTITFFILLAFVQSMETEYTFSIKVLGFSYNIPVDKSKADKCKQFIEKIKTAKTDFEKKL